MEWGKEEQREAVKVGVEELQSNVKLPNGARGRVICFRPDIGGKIGAKVCLCLRSLLECTGTEGTNRHGCALL